MIPIPTAKEFGETLNTENPGFRISRAWREGFDKCRELALKAIGEIQLQWRQEGVKYAQPENSGLAGEVFQELMYLADRFDSYSYSSAATSLRELAKTGKSPAFGCYWCVVHTESGQVVNDGFTKYDMTPGVFPDGIKGFEKRVMPLYAAPYSAK